MKNAFSFFVLSKKRERCAISGGGKSQTNLKPTHVLCAHRFTQMLRVWPGSQALPSAKDCDPQSEQGGRQQEQQRVHPFAAVDDQCSR